MMSCAFLRRLLLMLLMANFLRSCFTPAKERRIRDDIFNLQNRLLRLEQHAEEKSSKQNTSLKNQSKSLAQLQADYQKLERDLRMIQGELDRLKVGVETGELPGSESKNSIKQTLDAIMLRLEALETQQNELLNTLNSASQKATDNKKLNNLSSLLNAFNRKRYKDVVENAPRLIAREKSTKNKEQLLYHYAESLYKLGRLREAALKFNDFIEKYPKSKHLAHAKLRMGDCFRHLGDHGTARLYYEELITEFPNSDEAKMAKERLEKLKSNDKKGASVKKKLKKTQYSIKKKAGKKTKS